MCVSPCVYHCVFVCPLSRVSYMVFVCVYVCTYECGLNVSEICYYFHGSGGCGDETMAIMMI